MDGMCRRSRAGMDAGVNHFLGFALQNPEAKIATEGDFRPRKGLQRKYRKPPARIRTRSV
jgi:hypothetical protein